MLVSLGGKFTLEDILNIKARIELYDVADLGPLTPREGYLLFIYIKFFTAFKPSKRKK